MNRRDCLKTIAGSAPLLAVPSTRAAAAAEVSITIRPARILQENFAGAGFHNFHHLHADATSAAMRDQVILKRWRELGATFARVTDMWDLKADQRAALAEHLLELKRSNTTVYLTTWNPRDTQSGAERREYARTVVDNIEELVRGKGATNVRFYCMTNELSLKGWASLRHDLPKFRAYHQAIHEELNRRKLPVGLLATDASPIQFWDTIEWAAQNMDEITAIYGGHHYINDYGLDDPAFYPWFLSKLRYGAGIAASKGKDFILGEFGAKQYKGPKVDGKNWDACHYWDTPLEPWVGIQVAEAAIAAMNAGVYGFGYWTFADFPDTAGTTYANKWGLFKWTGRDTSARPIYYAYGLLARFFRGPARVFAVDSSDELVRVAAVQHTGSPASGSIAVVNRHDREVPIRIQSEGSTASMRVRKYVYDPAHPPLHPCADLQDPAANVEARDGGFRDVVGSGTLTVYTSAFSDSRPARVAGLEAVSEKGKWPALRWAANRESDLCYYRVFRSPQPGFEPRPANQIASTIGTELTDELAGRALTYYYKVRAVNTSGNSGEPSSEAKADM